MATPAQGAQPGMCCVCLSSMCTHATVPCGHLCLCGQCASNVEISGGCPSCRARLKPPKVMQIFYTCQVATKPTMPPLVLRPAAEPDMTTGALAAVLPLTNYSENEMEEVLRAWELVKDMERARSYYGPVGDMEVADALDVLNIEIDHETNDLFLAGDFAGYGQQITKEAERTWRSLCRMLHVDKAKATAASRQFYESSPNRYIRLGETTKYVNALKDFIVGFHAAYMVDMVEGSAVYYVIDDVHITMQIHFSDTSKQEDFTKQYSTMVRWTDSDGEDQDFECLPGDTVLTFDERDFPYFFGDDEQTVRVSHVSRFGPANGRESHPVLLNAYCPNEIINARKAAVDVKTKAEEDAKNAAIGKKSRATDEKKRREAELRQQVRELEEALAKHKEKNGMETRRDTPPPWRDQNPSAHHYMHNEGKKSNKLDEAYYKAMVYTESKKWGRYEEEIFRVAYEPLPNGYRPQKVCIVHDPKCGWFCNDTNCSCDHVDTRTKSGRKRMQAISEGSNKRFRQR